MMVIGREKHTCAQHDWRLLVARRLDLPSQLEYLSHAGGFRAVVSYICKRLERTRIWPGSGLVYTVAT